MASSDQHHLAPSSGSSFQFALASLPLLIVMLYMLHEASVRPNVPYYNLPQYVNDDVALQNYLENNADPMMPLYDMEMVFLCFFCWWSCLMVYVSVFVPKRRRLMQSFLEGNSKSVLGNVEPIKGMCPRLSRYGHVFYPHPETREMVTKKVRIYQHFFREQVTILHLQDEPFSGQPKTDVEIDIAAADGARNKAKSLVCIFIMWMIFCMVSAIYILNQMSKVEDLDDYERTSRGWRTFWIMVAVVTPLLAVVGNWLRFRAHWHWVVRRGQVVDSPDELAEIETRHNTIDTESVSEADYDAYPSEDERRGVSA